MNIWQEILPQATTHSSNAMNQQKTLLFTGTAILVYLGLELRLNFSDKNPTP